MDKNTENAILQELKKINTRLDTIENNHLKHLYENSNSMGLRADGITTRIDNISTRIDEAIKTRDTKIDSATKIITDRLNEIENKISGRDYYKIINTTAGTIAALAILLRLIFNVHLGK